ncbi:hypothetical protein CDAR_262281 [Caerostris darwini]|uniref:Uncharacterized protein n=1 Tax=Caerostris darwini TaxID=1538125 RepID=A0AAV4Q924_9ARAC|nr:hypothetical protein CDAR_262281 [Caerostris darwini]
MHVQLAKDRKVCVLFCDQLLWFQNVLMNVIAIPVVSFFPSYHSQPQLIDINHRHMYAPAGFAARGSARQSRDLDKNRVLRRGMAYRGEVVCQGSISNWSQRFEVLCLIRTHNLLVRVVLISIADEKYELTHFLNFLSFLILGCTA